MDGSRGRRCAGRPGRVFPAYLTDIGRSPNTVKAYSHDLKDYWEFLGFRGLDWREASLEDIGEFVAWLQLSPAGRAGEVSVLPSVTAEVGAATVNRKLAAAGGCQRVLCPPGPHRSRGPRSQSATTSAVRPSRTSTGRPVSASMRIVAQARPFFSA